MTRAGARLGSVALSLAALTLAARVLGFGRSLVFSKTVGDTCLGDTYNAANSLPNIVFEIVAGGVLAGVVVPVVARHVAAGRQQQTSQTVSALVTWTLLALTPAALLAMVGAPLYARIFASPACAGSADTLAALLVVFAPQVWLYGLAVVSAGVLQAHSRFLAAALAPLLSSILVMAAYLGFAALASPDSRNDLAQLSGPATAVLGWGTTLGVLALALGTLLPLGRLGLRIRPRLHFPGDDRRVLLRIGAAGLAGLVLQQLSVLLINWAAQRSGDAGALTRFTWANALYLLPYAVLVTPLLQVVFPRLSVAAGEEAATPGAGVPAVQRVLADTAPAVVALAWLGGALLAATAVPVARVFVLGPGSGRTGALAAPIAAFAPAVVGFAMLGLASRALLAQHRARDAGLATGLGWGTVILAVALLRLVVPAPTLVPAMAGSVSLGMVVGAVVGWWALSRAGVRVRLTRPLLAGLTAAAVAVVVCWWPASRLADQGLVVALLGGTGVALLCALTYLVVLAALDRPALTELRALRRGSGAARGEQHADR
ncbi:MAG: lipid II flippase MurJ [Friedmanniella sp.]